MPNDQTSNNSNPTSFNHINNRPLSPPPAPNTPGPTQKPQDPYGNIIMPRPQYGFYSHPTQSFAPDPRHPPWQFQSPPPQPYQASQHPQFQSPQSLQTQNLQSQSQFQAQSSTQNHPQPSSSFYATPLFQQSPNTIPYVDDPFPGLKRETHSQSQTEQRQDIPQIHRTIYPQPTGETSFSGFGWAVGTEGWAPGSATIGWGGVQGQISPAQWRKMDEDMKQEEASKKFNPARGW
ncbi:hypothetical protein TREMEDRAFT_64646 [Tremella mesenterica DSM 1558]|uniref:uncharacterized protein n=1 Tax=Tremella mesenterica (strain ATCC 24925 / CBS 8224 / DSM 1558 / NBRC 9311 / NRRL Y-6157 / RJB 2259-6 / UBC 559-6) TaxID=578456 RepID=UPI0003F4A50A|nr:uncharacterized protein TREMEDRAFT_64646 [Tremella mesenterica DSM 1558]EIW67393.1 hypothetical protein TREMEDRAFT_64646 [Tremella mesenterica DSM 1558]